MQQPKTVIEQLLLLGLNEPEIAEQLRSAGVPVTQATINRIRHGRIKRTSYEIGSGLVRLLETRTAASNPRSLDALDSAA